MKKSKRSWSGETGVIDDTTIKRSGQNITSPLNFVAGPPAMVAALKETLVSAGVKEDDIRAEDFSGY